MSDYNSDYDVRLATLEALGGDTTQKYDSVYEIDLAILNQTISGAGADIEVVDELPDASENSAKIVRLSTDNKIYVSNLLSSTTITTNKLPDDEQIDVAYLYEDSENFYYYKGAYTLVLSDGEINGYVWFMENNEEWYIIFTEDNAENVSLDSIMYSAYFEDSTIDTVNKIVTSPDISVEDSDTLSNWPAYPIVATYNAPEANQIGNAYLSDGDKCIYNGIKYTINYSDNVSIEAYGWTYEGGLYPSVFTPKKASDIYYKLTYDTQGYPAGKYTDAIGYFIDTDTYQIVNNEITLDYPSTDDYNALDDYQSIYIPQLNADDSEQVGVAYIEGDYKYIYQGEGTIVCTDGNLTIYRWMREDSIGEEYGDFLMTLYSAEDLYIDNSDYLTGKVNWEGNAEEYMEFNRSATQFISTHTISDTTAFLQEEPDESYSTISTVKYQRSVTTETWGWDSVATQEELDEKANKIDATVSYEMSASTYDFSNIDSFITDGRYNILCDLKMAGTSLMKTSGFVTVSVVSTTGYYFQWIELFIMNPSTGVITKTIIVRTSTDGTTWVQTLTMPIALIYDEAESTSTTYSSDKIESLIAGLDDRITALENQ